MKRKWEQRIKCQTCNELRAEVDFRIKDNRHMCRFCNEARQRAVTGEYYQAQFDKRLDDWWVKYGEQVKQWQSEYGIEFVVKTLEAQGQVRRAAEIRATPFWCDPRKVDAIYDEAARLTSETGVQHHVDHVVPLVGPKAKWGPFKGQRLVSGLNWEGNLQILPARENLTKSNRYWPDMPSVVGEMICYLQEFGYNATANTQM